MNKKEKFLELVERAYDPKFREALERQLKKRGEELIKAYPCIEIEHSQFPEDADVKEIVRRMLNVYVLVLRDKKGNQRRISFLSFIQELLKE